jgi:hypothetical protein
MSVSSSILSRRVTVWTPILLAPSAGTGGGGLCSPGRSLERRVLWQALVREIASHWRADPGAGPSDFMDCLVWLSLHQHAADMERLREGLPPRWPASLKRGVRP